jgi:hypothetical protein
LRPWPRGFKPPPHKLASYIIIAVGAVIVLFAMPFFIWAALFGGLIAYVGYMMQKGR